MKPNKMRFSAIVDIRHFKRRIVGLAPVQDRSIRILLIFPESLIRPMYRSLFLQDGLREARDWTRSDNQC